MSKNAYLICGEDDFQVEMASRALIERLVAPENRDFGLEVIEGRVENVDSCANTIRQCLQSVATDSLFGGGAKLTWFREPACLSIERIGRSETIKKLLQQLAERLKAGLPEGSSLLLTTLKINRTTLLFKSFQNAGVVQDFGSNLKPRQRLNAARQLLAEWLPKLGLEMSESVRTRFLDMVGCESRLLVSELQKLRAYCGESAVAREEDLKAIVSLGGEAVVWDFLDAFGDRDTAKLIKELRALLEQSESAVGLVTMLENRVNQLLLLRQALDNGWAQPGSGASLNWRSLPTAIESWFNDWEGDPRRMNSYVVSRLAARAGGWRINELRLARHHLLGLREALVSSNLPERWLLETRLPQAVARRRSASQGRRAVRGAR